MNDGAKVTAGLQLQKRHLQGSYLPACGRPPDMMAKYQINGPS
jgi:hypothetical protein